MHSMNQHSQSLYIFLSDSDKAYHYVNTKYKFFSVLQYQEEESDGQPQRENVCIIIIACFSFMELFHNAYEINSMARERGTCIATAVPVTVLPYQPSVQ